MVDRVHGQLEDTDLITGSMKIKQRLLHKASRTNVAMDKKAQPYKASTVKLLINDGTVVHHRFQRGVLR